MAASTATSGFGTLLKLGDGAGSETFTTIAEVKDITGPGLSAEVADITHHTSPGAWREKLATLLDAGELTFDVNFLPVDATQGNATGLISLMKNRTKRNYQLVFTNSGATTWTLPAYVTGFEPSASLDEGLSASVTLTLAGQPTLA